MNLRRNAALIASLMMSGLMPMGKAAEKRTRKAKRLAKESNDGTQ